MQRLLTLVFVLCLAIPAGISFTGCTRNPAGNYCNGEGNGLKLTDVASIDLEPRTTGVSLAFGQTQQLATPTAKTCKGNAASVTSYTWGTTNNQLVDISPTGNMCAGTWNRRSGGGIPDFTICNKPSPVPSTGGLPYQSAFVTATASAVTSNQLTIYIHAQVTAVSLVLESLGTTNAFTGCVSQTQTAQLDSQAFYSNPAGQQALLCGPQPTPGQPALPSCSTAIGNLAYTSQNTTIATIDQFGVITAQLPGTTAITASVAGSGSSAGYFSTCPPKSISVTLNSCDPNAVGGCTGSVTQGVTQNLVTTVVDTNNNPITGLTLDYQSTNPLDISASSTGAVTANFAGEAAIYAVCQPTTCNPAPINKVGVNQTGTPITSNSVTITTPGQASSFVWFANPDSQSFTPIELISGTVGSPVRMPYFPNSMVLDRTATSLYFGSSHELMIYSATSNSLTKEDPNVPGTVLAVSPDNQTVLINDPIRQLFYIYTAASGVFTTQSGLGTAAQWTPDAKTLYVVGTTPAGAPTLFVNNVNTGWTTYPLSTEQAATAAKNLAITVPGVGAFLSGSPTVAHAWCPNVSSSGTIIQAYPKAASVAAKTDALAATTDGEHILGVGLDGTTATLTDVNVNLFASLDGGACPAANTGITVNTPFTQTPLTNVQATSINQIVASPASNLAFVTYTGSGTTAASLPYYVPAASGAKGTVNYVPLTATGTSVPTAPVVGAFSLDDTQFFVSTSGDNLVHYINVTGATPTDTQQINPGLTCAAGNPDSCPVGQALPATFIAVKPRSTT
ncbi:hypothetical protein [Acidicapsa ligni]|uniref:hypothetical protein n=1 Tax=Acidicapsa ligni TaxID=542300 RepID=UPI0021DF71FD|nr:hypothetical protein [Acidicapsa ligni]